MYFETYVDRNGEYRWRLNAANHKTIADSGEGYKSLSDAYDGIAMVKSAHSAPVQAAGLLGFLRI